MGQVLAADCVGVVGYSMLRLALYIRKLPRYVSIRPIRDNPRLCAVAENKRGEEYAWGTVELATKNVSEAARVAEEVRTSDP